MAPVMAIASSSGPIWRTWALAEAKHKITELAERSSNLLPEQIEHSIRVIRGHKVLLDAQLAAFYGVPTKVLVQAVKRNQNRLPRDFMFQVAPEEWEALRSQIVIPKRERRGRRIPAGRWANLENLGYGP